MINRLISCIFLTFWECSEKIGQFIGQFKMAEMLVIAGIADIFMKSIVLAECIVNKMIFEKVKN